MKKRTLDEIKDLISANNVRFIRLQFTDIFGNMKNAAITVEQLDKALNNEIMFDGSSIEGFVRIEESDMYLYPDIDTFEILPWRGDVNGAVGRFICDVYKSDGTPFEGDPRYVLKKTMKEAEELGYNFYVGPELEFFLFHVDDEGKSTTVTHDNAGYFDLGHIDLGEGARRDICIMLEEMGFEIETSHHEAAPGQHEIDFKYADALTTADNVVTFKMVVKAVAQRHGLHATFMPKPIYGINGSGMHINQSLFKNGKNVFFNENEKYQLSQIAYNYIGGLLKYSKEMSAITNPIVNSYKRLIPGYEAPVYISWAVKNRSSLIRIPANRDVATRVELRNPDPSCNPYLAFALTLKAGLEGIKNNINPGEPKDINIFELTKEERECQDIQTLPSNLKEALDYMKNSEIARETLGEHIFQKYIEAKEIEWDNYKEKVHKWELDEYLMKY